MENAIEQNGARIARTPTGIGVLVDGTAANWATPIKVEVEYHGRRIKDEWIYANSPWRDAFADVNMLECVIRVKRDNVVLAELGDPWQGVLPFMVLQGEQQHITENYVAVPPALTITDEVGAVWTMGFVTAPKEKSPQGEFAFNVLRDGVDTGEIASRIERRNGKVRIFTKHGWKNWLGNSF